MKREDYISWDEYFMAIALLSAMRSKDPATQVGACIVDNQKKILSTGYNGAPIGYDDDKDMCWSREGDFLNTKYTYVCHSEMNAILNCNTSVRGATIYVALFPCHECAKVIIQSGIKEVIYASDKYDGTASNLASKKMFDTCKVHYRKYQPTNRTIEIPV